MMHRGALLSPVLLVACGPAAPPAAARPTVEVPAPEQAPAPAVDDAARLPAQPSDASGCIPTLRRAAGVQAESPEREIYERALAAEERGSWVEARKEYFQLVQSHPTSRLVPLAYLAFGEMFADEAAGDPAKWDLARASYQEVMKYPAPVNIAHAYAAARVGDSDRGRDDQRALASYKTAIESAARYPELPCAAAVRQRAESGLVQAFAEVGAPGRAWAFLRSTTGEARAQQLVTDLVALYLKAGKQPAACAAASAMGPGGAELARSACP